MSTQTYAFDFTHSNVGFTVRHMVVSKVHGKFAKWNGVLELDPSDLTKSSVSVQIEAASVDTGLGQRDDHLRSPDFFDAANHPFLTFSSRKVEKVSGDEYRLIGDLTIRGVTKEVALTTEFNGQQKSPWGDQRVGFSARTAVDRRDFGLLWNKAIEAGGVLVSDKVEISIEVEAIAPALAAAA